MSDRAVIEELWIDDLEDEYLLVKKVDQVLANMRHSRERLVVVLVDEALVRAKVEGQK